jgi:hypothetical protein
VIPDPEARGPSPAELESRYWEHSWLRIAAQFLFVLGVAGTVGTLFGLSPAMIVAVTALWLVLTRG